MAGKQGWIFVQKREGLRSTSHLCNNGADNGQRASSVSLKHALNSREPTNWLKPREPGRNQLPLPRQSSSMDGAAVMSDWNDEKSVRPFPAFVVVRMAQEENGKGWRGSSGAERAWSKAGRQVARVKLELSCEGERGELKEKQLV